MIRLKNEVSHTFFMVKFKDIQALSKAPFNISQHLIAKKVRVKYASIRINTIMAIFSTIYIRLSSKIVLQKNIGFSTFSTRFGP